MSPAVWRAGRGISPPGWRLPAASLLLAAATAGGASAATITVNSLGDTSVPGDGLCSLREAIRNANDKVDRSGGDCAVGSGADTIVFTVTGIIALTLVPETPSTALPPVTTDVAIQGPGAAALTVRVSGNSVRVLEVTAGGRLTLTGLTVADGLVPGAGGGGVLSLGTVVVTDVVFSNNAAANGGALYLSNTPNPLTRVTFAGNRASGNGGAIYAAPGSPLDVRSSAFTDNRADGNGGAVYGDGDLSGCTFSANTTGGNGGAVYNPFGTLTVADSTFTSNLATAGGGAIYVPDGVLTVARTSFTGNAADSGGGIFGGEAPTITVSRSTFTNNTALGGGGGILNTDGTLTVDQSTFTGNSASSGGAIEGGVGSNSVLASTLSGNSAVQGGGVSVSSGLSVVGSALSGNTATTEGGGVYVGTDAGFGISNSTLSGNTAGTSGGGLYASAASRPGTITHVTFYGNTASSGGALFSDVAPTLRNSIVAYSASGGNCAGAALPQDLGNNVQAPGSSCGNGILSDPSSPTDCSLLGPLAVNGGPTRTHALLVRPGLPLCPGPNPAIDGVPLAACPFPTDQRGAARPAGAACDMGAFELGPMPDLIFADGFQDQT